MKVVTLKSNGSLSWENLGVFRNIKCLNISYAPEWMHSHRAHYEVDSAKHSVPELLNQILIWAQERKEDRLIIYTDNSDEVNEELVLGLRKMQVIDPVGYGSGPFYFDQAYVLCEGEEYNNDELL